MPHVSFRTNCEFVCALHSLCDWLSDAFVDFITQTARPLERSVVPTRRSVLTRSSSSAVSTDFAARERSGVCSWFFPKSER